MKSTNVLNPCGRKQTDMLWLTIRQTYLITTLTLCCASAQGLTSVLNSVLNTHDLCQLIYKSTYLSRPIDADECSNGLANC